MTDLVVAGRLESAQLQPIECRLAGDRRTLLASRLQLARQHRHHRIVAQLLVVVEILIAQRDPEHPLSHKGHDLMLDQVRVPRVVKAPGKPVHQPDRTARRPKKQPSGIRGNHAAVECRHNLATFHGCKFERIRGTLCRHRGAP
jgi:hypothetical protein